MLFTSEIFLFYFLPSVLLIYYSFAFSRTLQNTVLFSASIIFYAWGAIEFIYLLLLSIVCNTLIGFFIEKYDHNIPIRKLMLLLAGMINLGILFVFKYMNFVASNINIALRQDISMKEIVVPLGLSFYTLQGLSYVIDVYKRKAKAEKNPFYVGLYIGFFPQLIAGPIMGYANMIQQIKERKSNWKRFSVGCCRFIVGFNKKVLLANQFAVVADYVFNRAPYEQLSVVLSWLGVLAYSLQVFFDLSAYSDMAIGLGALFGFKLEENVNYPYIAKSVDEFWKRWQITLLHYLKEYVYKPLGGSKVENEDKMVTNLLLVGLLIGLWHGPRWHFILWGFYHFLFVLGERFFKFEKWKVLGVFKHIYLLLVVSIGWVLFRAEHLGLASSYIKNLFGLNSNSFYSFTEIMFIREYGLFFIVGIILSMPIGRRVNKLLVERKMGTIGIVMELGYPFVMIGLMVVAIAYVVVGG